MRRILVVGLTAAALSLTLAPAHAEHWGKNDPREHGNFRFGDIKRVDAWHNSRRLNVDIAFHGVVYDETIIAINTHTKHQGAEFEFADLAYSRAYLRRATGNRTRVVRCRGLTGRATPNQRIYHASIPRRCIKLPNGRLPRRVQIKVMTADENYDIVDYAPRKRRASPWVRAS